eukprot:220061-Rhodomonas_salina.1
MPPGRASYSLTSATYSTSMPPGLASYSFTPATDSTSMQQGRASYSVTPATDSMSIIAASWSGELLRHSCHLLYEHDSWLSTFQFGRGDKIKPLARAANTRCYSRKGAHKSSMMIVEHHGQPGRSHEH